VPAASVRRLRPPLIIAIDRYGDSNGEATLARAPPSVRLHD